MAVSDQKRKSRAVRMAIGLGVIAVGIYAGYIALFISSASG
jgi:hypothetical protein